MLEFEIAKEIAGEGNVHEMPPMMGAEDFSYMLEARPGAYLLRQSRYRGPAPSRL